MIYGEESEEPETGAGAIAPTSSPVGGSSSNKEQEARKR